MSELRVDTLEKGDNSDVQMDIHVVKWMSRGASMKLFIIRF